MVMVMTTTMNDGDDDLKVTREMCECCTILH
jgi:hypothetical protein